MSETKFRSIILWFICNIRVRPVKENIMTFTTNLLFLDYEIILGVLYSNHLLILAFSILNKQGYLLSQLAVLVELSGPDGLLF